MHSRWYLFSSLAIVFLRPRNRYLSQNHPHTFSISPPRKTANYINNGMILLYDVAIFGMLDVPGVIRFIIIVSWVIQVIITDNPSLAGLTAGIERPMPTQMAHLKQGTTYLVLHLRRPHANSQFSNAIIEDLGDPEDEQFFSRQATSSGTVSGRVLSLASDAEINDSSPAVNIEEFPGVARRSEDAEPRTGTDTV
ncbi:hypothetical protein BU17DRAFT_68715 [Hysterangium stoloniferum]|nr:hypothetical protein BU17DRAFT_68715 [Hysterangium stoloniferum]